MKIKQKILTGFPCNNGQIYTVMIENGEMYHVSNKEVFNKAMKDGYIEIEESEER